MRIQNYKISQKYHRDGAYSRFVEVDLSDSESDQHIHFSVEIEAEGHPRVTEALLEALQNVRTAIGSEIHRFSHDAPFGT